MNFVCYNGDIVPADQPLFTAANRSFRYGDGLFETMKLWKSKIILDKFHFERLFLGLKMLNIQHEFIPARLTEYICQLAYENQCAALARIRLAVFRAEDNSAEFVIEASALPETFVEWNESGLELEIYPYARKHPDAFSNLKTANFLPYVLAELFAKERGVDDAVVLNADNLLCDTSKANIFLVRNGAVYTPAMHQGCVSGTMRRYLIDQMKLAGYRVYAQEISEEQLLEADEVFLTNSVFDLLYVRKFRHRQYGHEFSRRVYDQFIPKLYDFEVSSS